MRAALPRASERRVCRLPGVPRSALRAPAGAARPRPSLDAVLVERLRVLIRRHPTFGYRRLWALLRYGEGLLVNRKKIYHEQWLPEKNGFMSPSATRAAWYAQHGMEVAA